jgi:hypothetical protein
MINEYLIKFKYWKRTEGDPGPFNINYCREEKLEIISDVFSAYVAWQLIKDKYTIAPDKTPQLIDIKKL